MSFDIDIDTSEIIETARRFDATRDVIEDEVEETMWVSLSAFRQAIMTRTPTGATGHLKQSLTEPIINKVPTGFEGSVTFESAYAPWAEEGRDPGKMPFPPDLELWVLRKGGASAADVRSAAFALAVHIANNGTKGAHMVRDGFNSAEGRVRDYWRDIGGRIARRMEDKLQNG